MTIKTLTYIHDLLKEKVESEHGTYTHIRDLVTTARCDNATNIATLEKLQDKAWVDYTKARHALQDFEEQEF